MAYSSGVILDPQYPSLQKQSMEKAHALCPPSDYTGMI